MRRVLIYDRFDAQVCELAENDVFELTRHEVVNGEHELSITTTRVLDKGNRVLMEDDRGRWHEWAVSGIDELHANGSRPYGTYYCVWSVQQDLMGTRVSAMPGVQTPVTASQALDAALGGTARWTRGTVTNTSTGGASMYDTDGWSAVSTLVATWGGEVDVTIGVSSSGVISREVDLYAKQGQQDAKRRFDFGADLASIRRTFSDDPLYCRITPRGKGEQTDAGGYGRKITIESVNGGKDYLVNDDMVDIAKLPDGSGGWEYPTLEVENPDCETPAELLAWSQGVLEDYTLPKVTYEVNVVQAAMEGVDMHGVSLGDAVQVVDGKFDGLRLTGRVMETTTDELAGMVTLLTIGSVGVGLSGRVNNLYDGVRSSVMQLAQSLSTAEYIDELLGRINAEINATGGYTYITEGQGIRTYDTAVTDPLVGSEASAVVEIKGGTMRIANTKTAQGEWNWRTVFTAGHVAADMVTAANITAGYIGSPSGNYWNLDTGELTMLDTAAAVVDALGNETTFGDMVEMAQDASDAASQASTAAASAQSTANAAAKAQIGGTNLLIDSNHDKLAKRAADAPRKFSTNGTNVTRTLTTMSNPDARPASGITMSYNAAFSSGNNGKYAAVSFYDGKAVKMQNNQTYTVSCWAKTTGSAQIKMQYSQTSSKSSAKVALTTAWKRYSWTFKFVQSGVGGSGGARVYFVAICNGASAATVNIAGMKLEIGDKATDWSLSPQDVNFGIANAEALAKTYTNAISKTDREYTEAQRAALDASFNQGKVFNRLTNNGRSKGIVLKNGQLYINGTYIQTDTLNAGIIKTGILTDKMGKNRWNMATGYMYAKNAEFENSTVKGYLTSGTGNKAQFNNGTVRFFNGTKNALTIDGAIKFSDGNYGSHFTFPKYMVLRGPDLAVDDRTTGNGLIGATFTLRIQIPTAPGSSGTNKSTNANYKLPSLNPGQWNPYNPVWKTLTLSFINGICVHANLA